MEIIKHRVNTTKDIDSNLGIEIDIRDYNNQLVLSHDHPNKHCEKLENFIQNISKDQLLAINIKSTEIESELKLILDNSKIYNYFTFDWAIPSLTKALTQDIICAFRLSEYEKEIIPNCQWVWVDFFKDIWYDSNFLNSLKKAGLKVALVSPELHNKKSEINKVKDIISSVKIDAICTDHPDLWEI